MSQGCSTLRPSESTLSSKHKTEFLRLFFNCQGQNRAFLNRRGLKPGERHLRVTWDDGTVTLCTLRAVTVLSRNCCADFGCHFSRKVMSHSRDSPRVAAPLPKNIARAELPLLPLPPLRGEKIPERIRIRSQHLRVVNIATFLGCHHLKQILFLGSFFRFVGIGPNRALSSRFRPFHTGKCRDLRRNQTLSRTFRQDQTFSGFQKISDILRRFQTKSGIFRHFETRSDIFSDFILHDLP